MRTIYCEIDLAKLTHNYRLLQDQAGRSAVVAVVKADGYGHGDYQVALALQQAGCQYFAVARVHEGVKLRQAGVGRNILIMGGAFPGEFEDMCRFSLTPVVSCRENLEEMVAAGLRGLGVHLKVDTGMNRLGIHSDDLGGVVHTLRQSGFTLLGLMSHMACADEIQSPVNQLQLDRFQVALASLPAAERPALCHIANSATLFHFHRAEDFSLVRSGIMLYGGNPVPEVSIPLQPVMTLKTRVLQVKRLAVGEGVSYGHNFRATRPMQIAVIAVGYADGYPRLLSNKARVLIGGRFAPVLGNVCMDMTMIDVTGRPVSRGDEVVLFGTQGEQVLHAQELADICGTIDYEIFCGISQRVERVYING
ncbi:alanine racemase [Chrysiogenes arsenatis]|uniref:alanine racemase n=1 Tax=Chrysiogenes arsenatis TaxID=309797 RepID=UPI0003FB0596|nr:alanine racemase [Chrysiogenes arsenatis]